MTTTTKTQIDSAVYEAAHHGAVVTDRSDLGMFIITGETRLDLINRMSTQKVLNLQRGEGAATILTTDIGRIIDRIILYPTANTVYTLTSENNAQAIINYLQRFVFFNDDFHMQNISDGTFVLGLYGPQADAVLLAIGFEAEELPLHHWRQAKINDMTIYRHRTDAIGGEGYFVVGEMKNKEAVWQRLLGAGAVVADEAAFDFLRIEAGLPRFGHELTQEYIPLEANLWDDVSFSKGCYIGQEIIARMESRGRLAKRLVSLRPAALVEAGSELTADGKKAGSITSAAVGPNGPVALGYVKTAVLHARTPLFAGDTAVEVVKE